ATRGGPGARREARRLPLRVRRHAHGRATAAVDRGPRRERQGREPALSAAELHVQRDPARRGQPRHALRRRRGERHVGERRLLRLPQHDLRLHARGRRPAGHARAADRRPAAARVRVRRLLGADGHAQGPRAPRRARRARDPPLAGVVGRPPGRRRRVLTLDLGRGREQLRVLAIGAHSDDIEIGCGGTLLRLASEVQQLDLTWVVLSADGSRADEARAGAEAFGATTVEVEAYEDAFFKYGREVKEHFEGLKSRVARDVVRTHHGSDLHQDHRLVAELTWNTFRDHLILEYEIPKYDGDLGAPNVFVQLDEEIARRKLEALQRCFPSQAGKPWFTDDVFRGLLALRGMESRAPSGFAEAFYGRKLAV